MEEKNKTFIGMLRERTSSLAEQYDADNRLRVADLVTMTNRMRGDHFSFFLRYKDGRSAWKRHDSTGYVTFPVIPRSVKSKSATTALTKIQLDFIPVKQTPEKQAAAQIAKNIFEFLFDQSWSRKKDLSVAELCQLGRFCFIQNNWQTLAGAVLEIPEMEEKAVKTGMTQYICQDCGEEFYPESLELPDIADEYQEQDLSGVEDQNGIEDTTIYPCPLCETESVTLVERAKWEKDTVYTGNTYKTFSGKMDCNIISPLLIRIDPLTTQGFDYKKAGWFNYHPLIPAYEIIRVAPHLKEKIKGGNFERWSESARWFNELSRQNVSRPANGSYAYDQLLEVNIWWFSPTACHGWIADQDEKFEGIEFNIKAGETIADAWKRHFKAEFKGMSVILLGEELIAVGNEHFIEKWIGFPWEIDAQSFFPRGEETLLQLQHAATNVLNMMYSFVRKETLSKLVVDREYFNEDEIKSGQPGSIVYVKQAAKGDNFDFRRHIGYLQPGTLSGQVDKFIGLIIEIAKEASGVTNELTGNLQDTETLGARRIALQQATGLQSPTLQSKGEGMVNLAQTWLKLFQAKANDEAFSLIKGTFEEEWKEQDILAFRELDIDNELFVRVVEGTDIPKTPLEMENRFMVAVQMGLFDDANPLPVEVRAYIVKSVLGINYDVSNFNAMKRLAERRYQIVENEIALFSDDEAVIIAPDANGFPSRQLQPELVAALQQDPQMQVRATDDHLVFLNYYTDKLNGVLGRQEPNEALILAIESLIGGHRAMIAQAQAQVASLKQNLQPPTAPELSANALRDDVPV
jgi:hypothetical protein